MSRRAYRHVRTFRPEDVLKHNELRMPASRMKTLYMRPAFMPGAFEANCRSLSALAPERGGERRVFYWIFLSRRRRTASIPANPEPSSTSEAGSGTVVVPS